MHRSLSCCRTTRAWWVPVSLPAWCHCHSPAGHSTGSLSKANFWATYSNFAISWLQKDKFSDVGAVLLLLPLHSPVAIHSWRDPSAHRQHSTPVLSASARLLRAAWQDASTEGMERLGLWVRTLRAAEMQGRDRRIIAVSLRLRPCKTRSARLHMPFLMKVKSKQVC